MILLLYVGMFLSISEKKKDTACKECGMNKVHLYCLLLRILYRRIILFLRRVGWKMFPPHAGCH